MFLPEGFQTMESIARPLHYIIQDRVFRLNDHDLEDEVSGNFTQIIDHATCQLLQKIHFDVSVEKALNLKLWGARLESGIFGLYTPKFGFVRLHNPTFVPLSLPRKTYPNYWSRFEITKYNSDGPPIVPAREWNELFSEDFWIKNILTSPSKLRQLDPVLEKSLYYDDTNEITIINGKIRLEGLRRKIEDLELGIDLYQKNGVAAIDDRYPALAKYFPDTAASQLQVYKNQLNALEPFAANSILMPIEDFLRIEKKISDLDPNNEASAEREVETDTVTRIISFKRENPAARKKDVLASVGDGISVRRFNFYWSVANEKAPELELSKSGRK